MLFPSLFQRLRWNSARSQERRSRRHNAPARRAQLRASFVPRLEALEDRTVLSTLTVLNNLDSGAGGPCGIRSPPPAVAIRSSSIKASRARPSRWPAGSWPSPRASTSRVWGRISWPLAATTPAASSTSRPA